VTSQEPQSLGEALRDLLSPSDDTFALLRFAPNPGPQTRFLAGFDEPNTDQLYGGAAGGSKSTSLLLGALRACRRYPGLQAFWFRRTFPELRHSVLRLLARYGFGAPLGCRWLKTEHELHFPNGSILTFAHAKNVEDATALQSGEIQLLLIDERTTIPPDVVDLLYSRVRSGVPGLPCLGIRSATNPGNVGHSRVRVEYVEATEHGAREIVDAAGRVRRFIQAKVSDTPQLGPDYAASLQGLPEAMRKAFLDGDWDVFAGQMFSEWRFVRHVLEPFALPQSWRRLGGIDYGYRAPSAVLWGAVDPDGRIWVTRELYKTQLGEKGLARAILEATPAGETPVFAFDPSMAAKIGDAKPSAVVLQEEGVALQAGDNDRLSGWQRVHTYLADGPACPHHRALASRGLWSGDSCPMLHVFSNCTDLIRTLPALPHADKGKLEDADTTAEDHLPDALRYLVMSVGTSAGPVFHDDEPPSTALNGQVLLPLVSGRFAGDLSMGF